MIPPAFAELPFGEKLVLWAVRPWVRADTDDSGAHEFLNTGFKLAGANSACPALDGLMTVLATTGYRNIDIRIPNCAEISSPWATCRRWPSCTRLAPARR